MNDFAFQINDYLATGLFYRGTDTSLPARCGDVAYETDTGKTLIYDGEKWNDLGFPCDEPIERPAKITYPSNCKNCGAVMKSHVCEYCGTHY